MRNPLRNIVRRPADRPTLKQRAAALKATAARVLRRPSPPASPPEVITPLIGADPQLVALVAEWEGARRKLNDPNFPDGPEADAMGERDADLQREIYLFPARSVADLAAKIPAFREEAEDALSGYTGQAPEETLPGAAWAGLFRDIEHLAGAPAAVTASHEPDPIFAAIEASRAAQAAMAEWIAKTDAGPKLAGPDFAEEDRLNKAQYETQDAVIATVPTTAAGRLALLEYLRWQMGLYGIADGQPPEADSPFWRDAYKALKAALAFDGSANEPPAPEPDPVLGLIEGHRAAFAEWDRLSRRWNETPSKTPEFQRLAEACKEPSEREMTLFGALLHARPTTLGGVLALADYLPGAIQQVCPDREVTDGDIALKSVADALRPLAASSVAAAPTGHPLVNQLLAVWRDYAPYVVAIDLPPEVEADFERASEQRCQVIEAAERLPATMENVVPKALALAMIYGVELLHAGRSRKLYSGDGRLCFDLHLAVTGKSPAEV